METIIQYLRRHLRAAGASRWPPIAQAVSAGLPEGEQIGVALMRKIAYGDRDNPGVKTIQPLLDFFGAVERGERELPDPVIASTEQQAA